MKATPAIGHTFIDCYPSKYFFKHVLEWFNSEHATSFSLSTEEFLFRKFDNAQLARSDGTLKKLNYCLLVICKILSLLSKLNKKQINLDEFKQRIAFKFQMKAFLSSISLIFSYSLIPYLTYTSKITALVCVCVCLLFMRVFVRVINNAIEPLFVLTRHLLFCNCKTINCKRILLLPITFALFKKKFFAQSHRVRILDCNKTKRSKQVGKEH